MLSYLDSEPLTNYVWFPPVLQHMTCVQPSCKYQFCWECAGEYHTSTTCSRPKVKLEANSILAFDEYDRQCANHFLARRVALKGKTACHKQLEQAQRQEDAVELRVMAEGWSVLADAQSALAHTCIVMLNARSAKLTFLFECQKNQAVTLQQKFKEVWTSMETFPLVEAKAAIRDLRVRLRDYLLGVQAEIINERVAKSPPRRKSATARGITSPPLGRSPLRGMSNTGSPAMRRGSLSVGVSRGGSADSAIEDQVRGEDRQLLDILLQHQQQLTDGAELSGEPLSQSMLVDVATTVFGDALGGSWRHYSAYLAPPMVSGLKGAPPSQLKLSSPPLSGAGQRGTMLPVRSLGATIPLTFSTQPGRDAREFPHGTPESGDPPSWLSEPARAEALESEEREEELQAQNLHGFSWPPSSDLNPGVKRPRK
jgi:hypothetical protein